MRGRRGLLASAARIAAAGAVLPISRVTAAERLDAGALSVSPDAELLALGAQFERAAKEEAAAWALAEAHDDETLDDAAGALQEITSAIVDQIEACGAKTLAGVLVKVRAIAWCRCGEPLNNEDIGYHPLFRSGEPATDMQLVLTTMNDLLALAGVQS